MLVCGVRHTIYCFMIFSLIAIVTEGTHKLKFYLSKEKFMNIWYTHLLSYGCLNVYIFGMFDGFLYKIAVRAAFLGYAFVIGIIMSFVAPPSWQIFGVYISIMALFHYTEFLCTIWLDRFTSSVKSFIPHHSITYGVAVCASWIEFVIERHYYSPMKEFSSISYFGLVLCICGDVLRKLASFNYTYNIMCMVKNKKARRYELTTYGVYRICRHPGFSGYFYWSIGTQLILQNPVCFLAYIAISWKFSYDSILIEEIILLHFFGQDYVEYQKEVGTGLPYISGYKVDLKEPVCV